ncbi:hypothetical protein [Enterococcus faecalis]|uniref:hypothetical protein n=1 Tax=Enterococcus TaxID=1350 RepID=UPI001883599D|nr:hypothetical protein [Enterococcus faecalis]MBF0006444.1 hypothetical protein [Enterococcus faecalis]MBF0009127.1 hypothetical protein [Enterococcus faecalis]MBF0018408.1 hypothetical protein [Enterococcus faecalis]
MKGKVVFLIILLMVGGGSIYSFVQMKNDQIQNRDSQIQQLKKDKNQLNQELETQHQSFLTISEELESQKGLAVNDSGNIGNQLYQNAVTNVFNGLFSFTPDTYFSREKVISALLNDLLIDRYFGDHGYYGDANNTTSEVLKLSIYNRTIQKNTIDGLVIVSYQSKLAGEKFKMAKELYQVSFDVESGKFQEIKSLGSTLTVDLID